MERQWPECRSADPDAARDRYRKGMNASRAAVWELFRVELSVAHMGLGLVVIASGLVSVVWSPQVGAIIAGGFAALFVVTLAVALLMGRRRWGAVRAAYKCTFGWAGLVTP